MNVVCIGGGPGGLYLAILVKKAHPSWSVRVLERNKPTDTFGFGVVFSDRTLDGLARADAESHAEIARAFAHWDDIAIHYRGECLVSVGHGFAGMSRMRLLEILHARARALGVVLEFEREVPSVAALAQDADLVVAADGVNSRARDELARELGPTIDWRPNRFVWLGTSRRFDAFSFFFGETEHGLFRVHAYAYDASHSTFIVECTEATWRAAGLDKASEDETRRFCERLFAKELDGHALVSNRSLWRSFPTVRCARWSAKNVVLIGDAVHTAHFSIGSGTKLALEDAIALAGALAAEPTVTDALAAYERDRRPAIDSVQRAAQVSLEWFENVERYYGRLDPLTFAMSLLTRSLRITHANLAVRDPALALRADRAFAERAYAACGRTPPDEHVPPMFTPLTLRSLVLANRVVVSPMCQYRAVDGLIGDWHLVHLGSRAVGGAGLVVAEMTAISRAARITHGCAGIYSDAHVEAWARVVRYVHAESGAKIALQLGHAGRKGSATLPWEGDRPLAGDLAWPLVAASAIPFAPGWPAPRALEAHEIDALVLEYERAARRADQAGFDMLELHAAHGYLLSGFLSPLANTRADRYGGSLENRLRFPLAAFSAIRKAFDPSKPISVRLSATDWAPGGVGPAETVAIARAFKDAGADAIDVSAGGVVSHQRPEYGRLFQTPFADLVRHEAGLPTITVGAISSDEDVNSILIAGRADLCALARTHLYDPYWTLHAARHQGVALPWPDPYRAAESFTPRT